MLFLIVGSSGAGKTSVIKTLLKKYKFLKFCPSYTTRKIRPDEKNGNPYFFVTKQEFENMCLKGELLEWNCVHGNYYGVSKKIVYDSFKNLEYIITDIDAIGCMNLYGKLGSKCVTFFLHISSKSVLKERLMHRDLASIDEINKRLERFETENTFKNNFKYSVSNELDLEKTINDIGNIINFEVFLSKSNSVVYNTPPIRNIKICIISSYNKILLYRNILDSHNKWNIFNIWLLNNELPNIIIEKFIKNTFNEIDFTNSLSSKDYIHYVSDNIANVNENTSVHSYYYCIDVKYIDLSVTNINQENYPDSLYQFEWVDYESAIDGLDSIDKEIVKIKD